MRKLWLMIVLWLVVLAGCTSMNAPEWYKNYKNSDANLSMIYPSDWEIIEDQFGNLVLFQSPFLEWDQVKESVGIIVEELPEAISLQDYFDLSVNQISNFISDYQEIETSDLIIWEELQAKSITYKWTQGQYNPQWQQTFIIKYNLAYIITYNASAETFGLYTNQLNNMIDSIIIK